MLGVLGFICDPFGCAVGAGQAPEMTGHSQ
jgi:hypothetical protein